MLDNLVASVSRIHELTGSKAQNAVLEVPIWNLKVET